MPLKIDVPYGQKDEAKGKGAFWDSRAKTWYVPDHRDFNDFTEWMDTENFSIIVKLPFYIALNTRKCWKCGENTPVVSLACERHYDFDYVNEDAESEQWIRKDGLVFFQMTGLLDRELSELMKTHFPFSRPDYSHTAEETYWANHCTACDALQGDFYLHAEAGGAFFPVTEEEIQQLTLITVRTDFDVMVNSGTAWSSNGDEILQYAKRVDLGDF